MSAAAFQILAALVTASAGALATLAALSPSAARVKRLERLVALRQDATGSKGARSLDVAIQRASEEVVIDAEVNRDAQGIQVIIVPLVVTAAILTVITAGLFAEPGELQRNLVLSGAIGLYAVAIAASIVHLIVVQGRNQKRVEVFGVQKLPNLRDDEGLQPAGAEGLAQGDVPPA